MKEDILQALKWFFLMVFVVIGAYAFYIASQEDNIKPVMVGVISFGVVFIVFSFWKILRGKILMFSILTLIATAFTAHYLPQILYTYADFRLYSHYALRWTGLLFFPGTPFMLMIIRKFSSDYD